jgi:hypothetical protein
VAGGEPMRAALITRAGYGYDVKALVDLHGEVL